MATYTFQSSPSLDAEIVQFFQDFYRISDNPESHDEYVNQFTADSTFTLASKTGNGSAQIRAIREAMWAQVHSRTHTVQKVFSGPNSNDVMLHGEVSYELKNGHKSSVDWAARAEMVKGDDGKLRMSRYQVYLDTAAMVPK
ncbi:hypothetical protein FQN57_000201 [Myotisia sp. PD_48]|nr:hypothetical protein FQN57_000201 [Myotisia sp. PD_48]